MVAGPRPFSPGSGRSIEMMASRPETSTRSRSSARWSPSARAETPVPVVMMTVTGASTRIWSKLVMV